MIETEQMARFWTEDSENYDRIVRDELAGACCPAWQSLLASLGRDAKRALDFGCGPGFFSVLLARAGISVTGLDLSECMLGAARRNAARYAPNTQIDFILSKGSLAELPDAGFDLIVSRNVTWTLSDPVGTYREFLRLLRPGGTLAVFDANWHLPMFDPDLARRCAERERQCLERYGSTFDGPPASDPIDVRELPLSDKFRPDWDVGVLPACGFERVEADTNLIGSLWSPKERLLYGETPLFLVTARRPLS